VELHGAHGYILTSFLSTANDRLDEFGGSFSNRIRSLLQIVSNIRARCGKSFLLGVRLSAERYGLEMTEVVKLSQLLCDSREVDYLDFSLWDTFKHPADTNLSFRSLASHFPGIVRKGVRLGATGKIIGGISAITALELGFDFVFVGRAAVLHHDFVQVRLRSVI
jgi:2,4-dienoyl-CoA reductase-like NADH-dependent reductase (Old Yellow Enzyme family)